MTVAELMTREVTSCAPEDSLATAARLMWEHDVGFLPVADETGLLVGVVTDRDVCMAAFAEERRLDELKVTEAMTRDVRSVESRDSIDTAERVMQANQVRRLPVLDLERHVVGIVSLGDLALATLHNVRRGVDGLNEGAVASTLGVICEPLPPVSFVTTFELHDAGASGE